MPGTRITGGTNPSQNFGNIYGMFGPTSGSQPIQAGGASISNLLSGGGNLGSAGGPLGGYSNTPFAPNGLPGGVGNNAFGLPQQSLSTADNPLTAAWLGLYNTQANQAPAFVNYGSNLMQQGMPITQAGVAGMGQGYQSLQPAMDFYGNILSGNPNALSGAIGPQATSLAGQQANLLNQVQQGVPRSGFSSLAQANLPQAQAAQVGNYLEGQLAPAAQGLLAGGQAQANIGQLLANAGLGVSGFGANVAGMGLTAEQQLAQQVLNKMNINYQAPNWQQSLGAVTGAIGQLAGAGVGIGGAATGHFPTGGACWIAEAVYGVNDPRTHLVRAYLNGPFKQTAFGRLAMSLYLRFGQRVAAQVRKHQWLKRAFQPLFDKALNRAISWTQTFSLR